MDNNQLEHSLETKIHLFLDNQLTPNEESDLIAQIKQSSECCKKLTEEQIFRDFIKKNCPKRECTEALLAKIKACIDESK